MHGKVQMAHATDQHEHNKDDNCLVQRTSDRFVVAIATGNSKVGRLAAKLCRLTGSTISSRRRLTLYGVALATAARARGTTTSEFTATVAADRIAHGVAEA
jgi:hypothetical protein